MTMIEFIFYALASIAVLSALFLLFTKNVLYAAFSLVVTLMCVAGFYVFAGAEFLAITQIMVYVGGIIVLMIFGVMLTNKVGEKAIQTAIHNRFSAFLMCSGLFALLMWGILKINFPVTNIAHEEQLNNIEKLGVGLMSDYILPFEIAAVLLLVALIGAATIAATKNPDKDAG